MCIGSCIQLIDIEPTEDSRQTAHGGGLTSNLLEYVIISFVEKSKYITHHGVYHRYLYHYSISTSVPLLIFKIFYFAGISS